MNYEIALIIPNKTIAQSARHVIRDMNLSYPVYMASQNVATEIAHGLLARGTKVIISQGITSDHLKKELPIVVYNLPFSGLEAALAVKEAFSYLTKIAHIGTKSLYHYLSNSLKLFSIDPDAVYFHELDSDNTVEAQTEELIRRGFDVIIGGNAASKVAKLHGIRSIEISVDENVIYTAVTNAQMIAQTLAKEEDSALLLNTVLNSTSEAIISISHSGAILHANNAAQRLLGSDIIGVDIDEVLFNNRLVDIDSFSVEESDLMQNYTPVILKRSKPVRAGTSISQVIALSEVSDTGARLKHQRGDLVAKGFVASNTFDNIVGSSDAIVSLKEKAKKYARYNSTLLITGESGTGKELFAQGVHNESRRKNMPFVSVNCAALPESLIESELFGYEKGAFTGAAKEGKPGLFELADGGTLLLDEISEIPITTQSKLLRVIEEGDVIRIGGNHINVVDVRVICTSNKDLLQMIRDGMFKEDLYYRLSVLEINVPPLRNRKEDIDSLARSFLKRFCKQHDKNIAAIDTKVIESLKRLPFRGNVRELSNIIERMVIFSEEDIISFETMKQSLNQAQLKDIFEGPPSETAPVVSSLPDSSDTGTAQTESSVQSRNLEDMQKDLILKTLAENNGNKAATARALGIDTSTLWRRLKKYNM